MGAMDRPTAATSQPSSAKGARAGARTVTVTVVLSALTETREPSGATAKRAADDRVEWFRTERPAEHPPGWPRSTGHDRPGGDRRDAQQQQKGETDHAQGEFRVTILACGLRAAAAGSPTWHVTTTVWSHAREARIRSSLAAHPEGLGRDLADQAGPGAVEEGQRDHGEGADGASPEPTGRGHAGLSLVVRPSARCAFATTYRAASLFVTTGSTLMCVGPAQRRSQDQSVRNRDRGRKVGRKTLWIKDFGRNACGRTVTKHNAGRTSVGRPRRSACAISTPPRGACEGKGGWSPARAAF